MRIRSIAAVLLGGMAMLSTVLPALPATAAPANNDHASHGKQPSSPPSGHMKELFLDEDRFEMLSGPAKTALERRFGSRYAEVAPNTDPLATPLAPTDVPTLVNDPSVDTTARDTQSETTIALAGPNIVTSFNDSGSFNSNNHFTGWSTAPTSSPTFTDNGILPASTEGDAGDPVIAVDSVTNRVYLVTLGFTTGENLQVFRSDTNGLSFAAPVNATPGYAGSGTFQDKEWIAVDNNPGTGQGNVYIAWRTFPSSSGGGIRFTRSTDHGDTWGPTLGTTISSVSSVQGAYVVVGTDHSVSVFYFQAGALMVTKSTDFGVTFASPVQVTTIAASGTNGDLGLGGGFRTSAFPTAAVNPVNGNLYVVWNDRGASTDKADVFLTRSTDGGATWSPRVRVNDDAGLNDQFMPTLAVSPDGSRVFFGWYDRRNDPTNLGIQRFGSVASVDGGTGAVTTGASFAMSPMFPVVVGQDPNINTKYMGDYDQATADASNFYSVWGDNRDGDAFHVHQPDVRFNKLPIAASTTPADLVVTQTISPTAINIGGQTTATVTVKNNGPNPAQLVSLGDVLPSGLGFQSVSTSQGSCTGGLTVSCFIGDLASGSFATVTVQLIGLSGGTFNHQPRASAATGDPNAANNTSSVPVKVLGTTITTVTSTGNINLALPDVTTTTQSLVVSDAGPMSKVTASVRLNHTFDGDLTLTLKAPNGVSIPLAVRIGGPGDNYGSGANDCSGTPTTFDDGAATSITASSTPYDGTFQPQNPLSVVAGSNANGTWTLSIADQAGGDTGTLFCFSLAITRMHLPAFSVGDARVTEGAAGTTSVVNVPVTRAGDTTGESMVRWATASGTARAGADFPSQSGQLDFLPGETLKNVPVTVNGDSIPEYHETFAVNLSAPAGATIDDGAGSETITDDDGTNGAVLTIGDASVTEGNSGTRTMTFRIARGGVTTEAVTVKVATATAASPFLPAATAGADYVANAATVSIAAGATQATFAVTINGDVAAEGNEFLFANLTGAVNAVITDATGVGTIVDDEGAISPAPTTFLRIGDARVTEGAAGAHTPVNVRITRSGDTTGASSVSVASANGTATAPADYLALPATVVNFAAGETSKTVAVTVKGDSIPEYHEAFSLKLTSPTNASIIDAAGTVIITDDDAGAPASLSIANVQIGEPVGAAAPVALTITRSGDTSQAVTVKWATAPGTAASGIDFVAVAPTSLSFPAGVTTQTVSVTVNSDAIVEGTELFNVNISSAVNAVITDGSAAVTIFDDDY